MRQIVVRLTVVVILAVVTWRAGAGQTYVDRGYQIKAAYLYNFAKYVRWPDRFELTSASEQVFVLAIAGQDPFGDALRQIARTRTVQGHRINVVVVRDPASLPDCHMMFVPSTAAEDFAGPVLAAATERPVLVVGESQGFAQSGGMINFYVQGNKVKFEINDQAAAQAGLQISAKLLQIGKRVQSVTSVAPKPLQVARELAASHKAHD